MKTRVALTLILAILVLPSMRSRGEAVVYEPPPLTRDPFVWLNGSFAVGSTRRNLSESSHTGSVSVSDGGPGSSFGGIVTESVQYGGWASGGHSTLIKTFAGVGNLEQPTGCYGDAPAHVYGSNTYYILAGSAADLPSPPESVSIIVSFELGKDLQALNQHVVGHRVLNVPFNQWVEVWTFASADAHNRNTWIAARSVAEVSVYTDPTIIIDPDFPDAQLFRVQQASVAPPPSAVLPSILPLLLGD